MDEFARSLAKVLVHEGGYVNLKSDPGGPTNRGVTQRVYDDYRRAAGLPSKSVRDISSPEVENIYRGKYWNLIKGDRLPPGVSYVVFDGAVNSGVAQSAKWLQRALGIAADGVIGPATLEAVANTPDHAALIDRILDRRMAFLKALKTFKTFGKGWTARVNGVRTVGKSWVRGFNVDHMDVSLTANGNAKAFISDAKSAPPKAIGDAATGAGSLSVLITQTQEQLTPYASIGFVAKAAAFLTIAGLVVAVAGIAYRVWAKKKADAINDALDMSAAAT